MAFVSHVAGQSLLAPAARNPGVNLGGERILAVRDTPENGAYSPSSRTGREHGCYCACFQFAPLYPAHAFHKPASTTPARLLEWAIVLRASCASDWLPGCSAAGAG